MIGEACLVVTHAWCSPQPPVTFFGSYPSLDFFLGQQKTVVMLFIQ